MLAGALAKCTNRVRHRDQGARDGDVRSRKVDGAVFVGGAGANQGKFYDRFDALVLLSVPTGVQLSRIEARSANDFGKSPDDRTRILQDLEVVEPLLRRTATIEIDADRPLADVVDAVELVAIGIDSL